MTGAYTAAVMDADPEAAEPWLASMFVPGPSLREAVDRFGPMPLGGLRLLTAGLAGALMEIHRAGMVHRDLKPSNVLLAQDGPRVIDFGIAKAVATDIHLTSTGTVVGSPAFMSPEQAAGGPITPASDVFSVGAMLVLAATGTSPFEGASTPQTLYNVVHNAADVSSLPTALRGVVDACLDKNPANRPTPPQLLESVDTITAGVGWPGAVRDEIARQRADADRWVAADGRNESKAERRVSVKWVATAAVLALLGTGVGAAALFGPDSGDQADPLANRGLELSDEQLRLIETCALLGADVVGSVGQPIQPRLTTSTTCGADLVASDGGRLRMTVGVGAPIEPSATATGISLAGAQVLDSTADSDGCGRATVLRDQPRLGVAVTTVGDDACRAAEDGLRAVLTRLVTDPPIGNPPRQSVVRLDPCTSVDSSVLNPILGAGVVAAPVDSHTCTWRSEADEITVATAEATRVDADPKYTRLRIDGGALGDLEAARLVGLDGACTTNHLVRPTVADRAEMITVIVRPSAAANTACAASESVLIAVVDRLRKS